MEITFGDVLMKTTNFIITILSVTAFSFTLVACRSNKTDTSSKVENDSTTGAVNKTAYEHAQACAEELGPVPTFDISSGIEIPVEQNGVPVGEGEVLECDLPAAFQSPCEKGILGRIQGTRADGTANTDVIWTYIFRSGGFAAIGYHSVSGETCFLEIDTLPANPTVLEAPTTVGPETYNAQWASPKDMFEVSRCQDCHMADPFLHSPYIDQVRDPANPDVPLIPIVAGADNPRPPYQIISYPSGPYTTELPGNSCTSCHQPQCTTLFDGQNGYALDELVMPAPFHDMSTWDDPTSVADREEVRAWCNTLDPFGFQLGGGDDEDGDEEEVDDGPCDVAFECVFECPTTDYDCARTCGSTYLEGSSATTFAALIDCGEMAGCGVADFECLDSPCSTEFDAFIETCEDD